MLTIRRSAWSAIILISEKRSFIGFLKYIAIPLKKSGVPSLRYLSQYSSPICGGFDEFWENFMLIGYARISTDSQDHALQLYALRAAGCDKVFVETASGTRTDRPELAKLMEVAREGDTVVCWRLDRIGRSLRHLIEMAERLQQRGIAFRSLTENIDTSTPSGRFLFNILGALSSMEREIIVERTR